MVEEEYLVTLALGFIEAYVMAFQKFEEECSSTIFVAALYLSLRLVLTFTRTVEQAVFISWQGLRSHFASSSFSSSLTLRRSFQFSPTVFVFDMGYTIVKIFDAPRVSVGGYGRRRADLSRFRLRHQFAPFSLKFN